ncbi:MAG: peptidase domain-containing ABC transporter [Marinobacter sp.]|uniref:peptidase domain-containing ABC transporter n=1 Tax=Marinobacter sp. TaxID=50741 RepID=UPI0034A03DB2
MSATAQEALNAKFKEFVDPPISRESFVWMMGSLCRVHRFPFDQKMLLEQFPPPYTRASFQQASEALGFVVELHRGTLASLKSEKLPCVVHQRAELNDPACEDSDTGETTLCPALVVRADGERILYFEPGSDTPHTAGVEEADRRFEPLALGVLPADTPPPEDEAHAEPKRFGFSWFIPEMLRHQRVWRDIIIASLAIQLLGLAMPLFTQVIIDKVIVHNTLNTLLVVAVALVMFAIFTAIMTWIRQYLVLHTGNRIDAVLGANVFSHLFRLPMRYFEQRPTGTLVARIEGIETIRSFITGAAVTLVLDLPFMFVFLAVMFFYSWQLTLIVLGILLAIAIISISIAPALRRRLNEQFQLGARNQAFLVEYITGMETVKSLQMEPQLRNRFGDYLASYLGSSFRARNLFNTYNVSANTLEQIQSLAILCVGAWIVMTTNTMTVGMLVAFQMFASRLSQPVLRLVGLWQEFQQANIAVKRLGDVMDAPAEPYSLTPSRAPGGKGQIEIQSLGFRYADDRPPLYRNLNLTIKPGTAVALTGPSGCGKSTLAKLLQGFYRPTEGRILIDGRDVCNLTANELRAHFGVVPQETQLFSGTIYDNLIAANPHATFEQVVQACRLAEIHETVEGLPEGYQTALGERGVGLSGGQKQRLAIARALLKRPQILIFDEATSALDAATAEQFAQTVNKLRGKVTLVFITHQVPRGLAIDEHLTLQRGLAG